MTSTKYHRFLIGNDYFEYTPSDLDPNSKNPVYQKRRLLIEKGLQAMGRDKPEAFLCVVPSIREIEKRMWMDHLHRTPYKKRSMSKNQESYVCTNCGKVFPLYHEACPYCFETTIRYAHIYYVQGQCYDQKARAYQKINLESKAITCYRKALRTYDKIDPFYQDLYKKSRQKVVADYIQLVKLGMDEYWNILNEKMEQVPYSFSLCRDYLALCMKKGVPAASLAPWILKLKPNKVSTAEWIRLYVRCIRYYNEKNEDNAWIIERLLQLLKEK